MRRGYNINNVIPRFLNLDNDNKGYDPPIKIEVKKEHKMKKVWITKNLFTEGIEVVEARVHNHGVFIVHNRVLLFKPDWHETRKEAIDQALIMVREKLIELDKEKSNVLRTQIKIGYTE